MVFQIISDPQSTEKSSGENVFAEQGNPGYNGIIKPNAEANSGGQRGKRILLGGKLWSEGPDTGKQGRGQAEGAGGAKNPSSVAISWQGNDVYKGIDNWSDVTLKQGDVYYRGEPGGAGFFTKKSSIESVGAEKSELFKGLQVQEHPLYGYRGEMQGYMLTEDLSAAEAKCLANSQFGKGGLEQLFIPNTQELIKKGILIPVENIELK